jgi:NB-ARC domain
MSYDQPGYELHFHGLGQSAVIGDYKKVAQILHSGLTQSTSVHQLPPDILDFTGRQAELDRLTYKMRQATEGKGKSSTIFVVTGKAGVGKSALAIHGADGLKSDFPDAQLYVNLRRRDNHPLEPFEVLAGFLRAWGVDEYSMPKNVTQRSNLYRSLLSGQRVLVLLDNADDEVQVRPLLPDSPTCAVLITSRNRFATLEGADILNLAGMTQTESLQLLQHLVGVDRTQAELEAAKNIIDLCSQLPLAIRIAGGMLRSKPDEKLRDYADKLTDERQQLAQSYFSDLDVRANLTLSYHEFDGNTARLFQLLGLLSGSSFTSGLAAVMLDCEPQTAQKSVNSLMDKQLLQPISQERYRFHDLVRRFARGQLAVFETAQMRQAARLRVCCWYLEMAQSMNLALNPEDCRYLAEVLAQDKDKSLDAIAQKLRQVALNWFEAERRNLLLAVEWAYQAQAREIALPLTIKPGQLLSYIYLLG